MLKNVEKNGETKARVESGAPNRRYPKMLRKNVSGSGSWMSLSGTDNVRTGEKVFSSSSREGPRPGKGYSRKVEKKRRNGSTRKK